MPIGWAIAGSALIGAVGSNMAANTQAGAQQQAAQTQQNMFNTIQGQEQPFLQAGYGATKSLNELMGLSPATGTGGTAGGTGLPGGYLTQQFSPKDLQNYPGYQFQLQQGDQAVENAASVNTGAVSGPALKSLMDFNQQQASTTYGQAFNQFQTQQNNIFSRLSSIAGLGQNAAGNLGNTGAQLGTGIAGAQAAAGGSLAGGIVGATNSIGGSAVPLAYLMNQGSGGINSADSGAFGASTGTTSGTAYNYLYGGE
jgi:hypothetical protein